MIYFVLAFFVVIAIVIGRLTGFDVLDDRKKDCLDSDKDNIFNKGNVTITIADKPKIFFDSCDSAAIVKEWTCKLSGNKEQVFLSCPLKYTCVDGACGEDII